MARWRSCVFLVVVLISEADAQEAPKLPPGEVVPPGTKMHRMQAGKPDKDGWYRAQSTEGHFRVKLPVPFNDFTVRVNEKDGWEFVSYGIGSKSIEGVKFFAMETPNVRDAGKTREQRLKGFADGMRENGNTVSKEK